MASARRPRLRRYAQVIVGFIYPLFQCQHLVQVGLGCQVVTDLAIDQRQGKQQVAVPGRLGRQNFELFAGGRHIARGQQPGILQAQALVFRVILYGRFERANGFFAPWLSESRPPAESPGAGRVPARNRLQFFQGLLVLFEFGVQQGLGEHQLGVFRELLASSLMPCTSSARCCSSRCRKPLSSAGNLA